MRNANSLTENLLNEEYCHQVWPTMEHQLLKCGSSAQLDGEFTKQWMLYTNDSIGLHYQQLLNHEHFLLYFSPKRRFERLVLKEMGRICDQITDLLLHVEFFIEWMECFQSPVTVSGDISFYYYCVRPLFLRFRNSRYLRSLRSIQLIILSLCYPLLWAVGCILHLL